MRQNCSNDTSPPRPSPQPGGIQYTQVSTYTREVELRHQYYCAAAKNLYLGVYSLHGPIFEYNWKTFTSNSCGGLADSALLPASPVLPTPPANRIDSPQAQVCRVTYKSITFNTLGDLQQAEPTLRALAY